MGAFRRVLLGLHQDSGDVVDVFQQWREWRAKNGVNFSSGDRTAYYAQSGFPADFLEFVRRHYIPAASKAPLAITALVEYEPALLGPDLESHQEHVSHDLEKPISPPSRPPLLPAVNVVPAPPHYHQLVRRLH